MASAFSEVILQTHFFLLILGKSIPGKKHTEIESKECINIKMIYMRCRKQDAIIIVHISLRAT